MENIKLIITNFHNLQADAAAKQAEDTCSLCGGSGIMINQAGEGQLCSCYHQKKKQNLTIIIARKFIAL